MYIPTQCHFQASWHERLEIVTGPSHETQLGAISALYRFIMSPFRHLTNVNPNSQESLHKRQFSSNKSHNTNIKIGLIVGFVLAAFIAVIIAFLWFYGRSTRITYRNKKRRNHHRHHHRHKSTSSKDSRTSGRGTPPTPQPAPERDAPDEGAPPAEDKAGEG